MSLKLENKLVVPFTRNQNTLPTITISTGIFLVPLLQIVENILCDTKVDNRCLVKFI